MTNLIKKATLLLTFWLLCIAIPLPAQVGIRIESESNTSDPFPHLSAELDISSNKRGVLLPRVNISSISNANSPISTPVSGLIAFNSNVNTNPGLVYWDTHPLATNSQYNRIFNFLETPKMVTITFNRNMDGLANYDAGFRFFYLGQQNTFTTNSGTFNGNGNPTYWNSMLTLDNTYLTSVKLGTAYLSHNTFTTNGFGQFSGVILPAGTYNIEVNYNIIANSTNSSRYSSLNRGTVTSEFYDMGYFGDLCTAENKVTSPTNTSLVTTMRSEMHVISKRNQLHSANFFYNITLTKESFVTFVIGRVDGSSYRDKVTIQKEGSYIKINKIK